MVVDKSIALYTVRKYEYENFIGFLDSKDRWEKKKAKLDRRFHARFSQSKIELDELEADRSKKTALVKRIEEKKARSEMLEQLSKSLLLGSSDVDYLQNEESCDILFKET